MCSGNAGFENIYLRFKRNRNGFVNDNLAVGDFVLLVDENCPRGRWPKGIIQEVFPDHHGVVRHVAVRAATANLRHDVRKLCLLERSLISGK